ncbi:MAG: hypothetical protein APR63_01870 [Desulfuromonas sp. SDB]|nr:MAG: hypothetical protein APR63_01870 [Desulfuromonas sp. SDB]
MEKKVKKVDKSILVPWMLFVLALILLFLTSIISVVPDSFADQFVRFLQPLLVILGIGFLFHAVVRTVIGFKKNNQ